MTDYPDRVAPATSRSNQRNAARIDTLANALRALIRDTFVERFGHGSETGPMELDFKVSIDPNANWDLRFETPLVEQLKPQLERQEAEHGAFREGSVYCYRCESAACAHSRPGTPLEVFHGYDQLGCPLWAELTQVLLDAGDEGVGELFGPKPKLITRQVRGRDLIARQLTSFGRGSKTFSLMGQIITGYLHWPGLSGENERLAISFQAVQHHDVRGNLTLALNRVCKLPDDVEFSELVAHHFPWVKRAESNARDALKKLTDRLNNLAPGENQGTFLARVPEVLRRFSGDLAQGERQARRQTNHARDRRRIQRPVDMAMADLRKARPGHMYLDQKTQAIVLCGNKGRCHIFNENGRHVTSFVIQPDAVELRLRKRRWSRLEPERMHNFLQQFA
ncbi:MAG: hypothetical protein QNK37_18190 [Acidobacteriota bacterium]|nr:hypothetical protein [Acidobacteriota bacterium]